MAKKFPTRPHIRKLGTIACNNIVETTPLIWKGELYRFEVVRRKSFTAGTVSAHWSELDDAPCLRFIHVRSNTATPLFAEEHTFGFPYVIGDTMHVVTGVGREWGAETLELLRSDDLVNWEKYGQIHLPGWKIYNMNIAEKDGLYTLLIEISEPVEEAGEYPYTFRFLQSRDMTNWELLPREYVFQKDRYSGSPSLYTFPEDPYYYVGYLEEYPLYRFGQSLARSKDLVHWEYSPINPVLMYNELEDKQFASAFLTPADRKRIEEALDTNNSDMEMCEYLGRTLIYYSWGDQRGTEFLAEAWYEGPMHELLSAFFEPKQNG